MSQRHRLPDDSRELKRRAISWTRRRRAQAKAAADDRHADKSTINRQRVISAETDVDKYAIGGSTATNDEDQWKKSNSPKSWIDDTDDEVTLRVSNTASSSSRAMTKNHSSAAVIAALNKSFASITNSDEYQIDEDVMKKQEHRVNSTSLLRLFEDTTPQPDDMALKTSNTKSSSHPRTRLHSSAAFTFSLSESLCISSSKEYPLDDKIRKKQEQSKKNRRRVSENVATSSSPDDDVRALRTRATSWPLTKNQSSAVPNTSLSESEHHLDHQREKWKTQEEPPRIPSSLLGDDTSVGIEASRRDKNNEHQHHRSSEPGSSSHEPSKFNTSSAVLPPSERLMRIREELKKKAHKAKQAKEQKESSRTLREGAGKRQPRLKEPDSTIEEIALLLADAAKNSSSRNKSQR